MIVSSGEMAVYLTLI